MISASNILVGSDFSEASDLALRAASILSSKSKSSLQVLHVCEFPISWSWTEDPIITNYYEDKLELEMTSYSKKRLDQQMGRLEMACESYVALGIPFEKMLSHIKEKNIGLLVMGHKGKGMGPFHLGSMAAKMIATSPIPILIVKDEFRTKKIAALVDTNENLNLILNASKELSAIMSCPLEIITVFKDTNIVKMPPPKTIKEQIQKDLGANATAEIRIEITCEKIAHHLNSILSSENFPLVVMHKHHASFIKRLIIGSETRRMLEIYDGNLLVLPP